MPILNRIAEFQPDMTAWRQHLHANPELGFDTANTAAFVSERLREFGVDEIHGGIAQNGLVAIIRGQAEGPVIGLRADMDALPITEETGVSYTSTKPGKMHACGHDGHTTMLLGAARYLAETRNFVGSVALIFQPAEEDGGGGQVMCNENVLERFKIDRVFALHTDPSLPLGHFSTRSGPVMAAADVFRVKVQGRGAHAADPDMGIDPILVAIQMIQGINAIRSRMLAGRDPVVISVTMFNAGTADNIIPDTATFVGTVRSLAADSRQKTADLIVQIVESTAAAFGATALVDYEWGYPVTVNHAQSTEFAATIAREISGADGVDTNRDADFGAEDFSYFLEKRPGSYVFLGQGVGAGWHHPKFNFNDAAAPYGASFFVKLVETAQPVLR